jgi:hypothetical protein
LQAVVEEFDKLLEREIEREWWWHAIAQFLVAIAAPN